MSPAHAAPRAARAPEATPATPRPRPKRVTFAAPPPAVAQGPKTPSVSATSKSKRQSPRSPAATPAPKATPSPAPPPLAKSKRRSPVVATPVPRIAPAPKPPVQPQPIARTRDGRYVVTAPKSPFYKYGPAQSFGADFVLPRGRQLTVVKYSYGFSKVLTDDGITGYMPTDDLAVAPPEPAPRFTTQPRSLAGGKRPRGSQGTGSQFYTGPVRKPSAVEKVDGAPPLFDVFDVPLPSNPDAPKPAPDKPGSPAPEPAKPTATEPAPAAEPEKPAAD
jgi:hypothetical protein